MKKIDMLQILFLLDYANTAKEHADMCAVKGDLDAAEKWLKEYSIRMLAYYKLRSSL